MASQLYQKMYQEPDPLMINLDADGILKEIMEEAAAAPHIHDENLGEAFTGAYYATNIYRPDQSRTSTISSLTPPESEESHAIPSPSGACRNPVAKLSLDNFSFLPRNPIVPQPVPSTASASTSLAASTGCRSKSFSAADLTASATFGGKYGSFGKERPRKTFAESNAARVEVINPKLEFDKIQKKYGPKGQMSEQRIADGLVKMKITCIQPLRNDGIKIYVQRENEANKKLTAKNPQTYGLGPTMLSPLEITPAEGLLPTYICSLDLDCVFKTPDGKEVYHLERTQGWFYNRFELQVNLTFQDGSLQVLWPYEFILKSIRTPKANTGTRHRSSPVTNFASPSSTGTISLAPSPPEQRDVQRASLICHHLEAAFAKINNLEVEQIQTKNHDIAYKYYIKEKNPGERRTFEEGDVVGFFEDSNGETVIDLLTTENAPVAKLAGVISRSAYLVGKDENSDSPTPTVQRKRDADQVCIVGEINVKVIGRVRTGDLIYTCSSDQFPGTATAVLSQGGHRQTLLGYSMGESRGEGVTKVACLVSLVLSIGSKEQLRALEQLRSNVSSITDDLESRINNVGKRITGIQRGWRGARKKLLALAMFLSLVSVVCGLMLVPNSPYMKHRCRTGSIPGHSLLFFFHPHDSDDAFPVEGLEFEWEVLQKKLRLKFDKMKNGTEPHRYFLNKKRCEAGGIRTISSWLDPSPKIPRVNVLAVDSKCKTVYYHGSRGGDWVSYSHQTAVSIQCKPQ